MQHRYAKKVCNKAGESSRVLHCRLRGCSEPMKLPIKSGFQKLRHVAVSLSEWLSHLVISGFSLPLLIVLAFAWPVGSVHIKENPCPFSSSVGRVMLGTTSPSQPHWYCIR